MKTTALTLRSDLVRPQEINKDQRKQLFALMEESYNAVSFEQFNLDLNGKNYILLLLDNIKIVGFTTYLIDPPGIPLKDYHVIFSGDTVIAPDHWGSLEMVRGGWHHAGRMMASDSDKPWYWFLISKGHRTYMYLPLFFNQYIPAMKEGEWAPALYEKLDHCASHYFKADWKSDKGIIQFEKSKGELTSELAQATFDKAKKDQVKFFLSKNPNFYKGDELACFAQLHPDNLRSYAKNFFTQGMQDPLDLE